MALAWPPAVGADNFFVDLSRRLAADGFDRARIEAWYAVPEAVFETEGVSLFFVHSEARLDYAQFAAPEAIARARDYMGRHRRVLDDTAAAYGVAPEVITGIILVETRLGTFTGKQRVFNTLSTMAALADPVVRDQFWKRIPPARRISADRFETKANAKSAWAYGELKAFLRYTAREGLDPLEVVGSYAGAMGICQFMPSNALTLAVDGDGDGRVNLFDHSDAIASVANYLRHHSWRAGLTRDQRYRVILRYNYSKPYAETILTIADRLGG
jgi:membrane-bound lytic murein transglycosylase B